MDKDGQYHSAAFTGILPDSCSGFAGDCREQRLRAGRGILCFNSSLEFAVSVAASAGSCIMTAAKHVQKHTFWIWGRWIWVWVLK